MLINTLVTNKDIKYKLTDSLQTFKIQSRSQYCKRAKYNNLENMNKYTYLLKYIIIGDASVGKSCLLMQFLQSKFKTDSETTIGVEFGSKNIDVSQQKIKLQIWDTAGQQIFKSITRSYYRNSIGAILVYDITNKNSFKNLQKWIEETRSYANEKLSIILVGNKNDLEQQRQVTYDEGKKFAQEHNMLFVQCSAKNTELTEAVFIKLSAEILQKISTNQINPKNQILGIKIGTYRREISLGDPVVPRKGYCC